MTSTPIEPGAGSDDGGTPAGGDLGVGGPAESTGDAGTAQTPPGYPEEVDPREGPVPGAGDDRGDLTDPGAEPAD